MKLVTRFRKNGIEYRIGSVGLADAIASAKAYALQSRDYAQACADIATRYTRLVGGNSIPTFSADVAYAYNDLVWYDNKLYRCIVASRPAGPWSDASFEETSLFAEYARLVDPNTQYELCIIKVNVVSGSLLPSAVNIYITYDNTTYTYNVDQTGQYAITLPWGTAYTVSVEDQQGYMTHKVRAFTSNSFSRTVVFNFHEVASGLSVIDSSGNEWDIDSWDTAMNSYARLLRFRSSTVNFCMKIGQTIATNTKWQAEQVLITGVTTTTNSTAAGQDANGEYNTDYIMNFAMNKSNDNPTTYPTPKSYAPAAGWCREQSVTINNVPYYGYLPSGAELLAFDANRKAINDAMVKLGGRTYDPRTGNWWSSTQSYADSAWDLTNGGLNLNGKTNGLTVIPFFAF